MLSLFKKARAHGVRAGLSAAQRGLAVALVRRSKGQRPLLEHCAFQAEASLSNAGALAALLDKLPLAQTPLSAVIDADDYQLVQVEAPDVLPAELRAAIRWRLRDVVNFDIDAATLDVFEIPEKSRHTQSKMLFAVAARTAAVHACTAMIAPHAPGLDVIDIPELCLRNLSNLLPQDQNGVALLALCENFAQLVLTRQGVLYLARRIEFGRRLHVAQVGDAAEIDAANLALELQRSLDYYESHYDQPTIAELVIAPCTGSARQLAAALESETSLRISLFDIEAVLDVTNGVDRDAGWHALMALGAALRTETAGP